MKEEGFYIKSGYKQQLVWLWQALFAGSSSDLHLDSPAPPLVCRHRGYPGLNDNDNPPWIVLLASIRALSIDGALVNMRSFPGFNVCAKK